MARQVSRRLPLLHIDLKHSYILVNDARDIVICRRAKLHETLIENRNFQTEVDREEAGEALHHYLYIRPIKRLHGEFSYLLRGYRLIVRKHNLKKFIFPLKKPKEFFFFEGFVQILTARVRGGAIPFRFRERNWRKSSARTGIRRSSRPKIGT